jgi:hypothetical protein
MAKEGEKMEEQEVNSIVSTVPKTNKCKGHAMSCNRDPLNMDIYLLCNNNHHTVAIVTFTLVQYFTTLKLDYTRNNSEGLVQRTGCNTSPCKLTAAQ